MKVYILIVVFVTTYISITHSNPNLRKGELIESIIIKQTQGNYEEAIIIFAEIGKLVRNLTVDLSCKEQKLFFDCYHYRRIQLRKDLVDDDKYSNKEGVEKKSLFYNLISETFLDLRIGSLLQMEQTPVGKKKYDLFWDKMNTDKQYFEAWYSGYGVNIYGLQRCYQSYERLLPELRTLFSDADLMVLDTCLGFSTAKLEYNTISSFSDSTGINPCDSAQNGLARGLNASSEDNPDLIPLNQFVNNYCKPGAKDILMDKYFVGG